MILKSTISTWLSAGVGRLHRASARSDVSWLALPTFLPHHSLLGGLFAIARFSEALFISLLEFNLTDFYTFSDGPMVKHQHIVVSSC